MRNAPRITYATRPDVTSEQVRDARARAWAFVFDCYAKKKAAGSSGGEDTRKEDLNASGNVSISR